MPSKSEKVVALEQRVATLEGIFGGLLPKDGEDASIVQRMSQAHKEHHDMAMQFFDQAFLFLGPPAERRKNSDKQQKQRQKQQGGQG